MFWWGVGVGCGTHLNVGLRGGDGRVIRKEKKKGIDWMREKHFPENSKWLRLPAGEWGSIHPGVFFWICGHSEKRHVGDL